MGVILASFLAGLVLPYEDADALLRVQATARIEIDGRVTFEGKVPMSEDSDLAWRRLVKQALKGREKELPKRLQDLKARVKQSPPAKEPGSRRMTLAISKEPVLRALGQIERRAAIKIIAQEPFGADLDQMSQCNRRPTGRPDCQGLGTSCGGRRGWIDQGHQWRRASQADGNSCLLTQIRHKGLRVY